MAVIINGNNTPTAGGVAYGNGTELAFGTAGSADHVLISTGSGAPEFSTVLKASEANQGVGVGVAADGTQWLHIAAGTASKGPLEFTNGTLMTTPNPGVMEYDGINLSFTNDDQSRRGFVPAKQVFRLSASGSALGPTIADYFGANSAVQLAAGGEYEIVYYCYFTKTSSGTVTFTVTSSQTPLSINGILQYGAVGGGTATGAANQIALFNSTATAAAFGATGSLSAANHAFTIRLMYEQHATNAGDVRLRVTSSAGTVTPLRGSYYTVTRLPAGNSGNFVA